MSNNKGFVRADTEQNYIIGVTRLFGLVTKFRILLNIKIKISMKVWKHIMKYEQAPLVITHKIILSILRNTISHNEANWLMKLTSYRMSVVRGKNFISFSFECI